jgi:transposase
MSLEVTEAWIGRQTPDVQAVVRMLLARIAEQDRRIAELEARVDDLQGRLSRSPQNSSLPPSSQHPHAKAPITKPKSKKKRGGQPGHVKHERPLFPIEQCNEVHTLKPNECRRCGAKLTGVDAEPLRHQVWELPEIRPIVTEYQRHRLTCSCCATTTCAPLPPGVPSGQAGPRLTALAALLMGCFRQSKSRVALFLEQVLGQPCSTGWVVKLQNQATAALRPNWEELAAQLPNQDNLGIDETPTKEGSRKSWLWACVAKPFTVFALRPTRAATVLDELLGGTFRGVTNCDRAKMYWSLGRLQWCWAHLKRDFQALVDSADRKAQSLGRELLRHTGELFRRWGRYRDGALTRRGFVRQMQPIRAKIESLLLRGAFSGNDRLIGMCNELYDHRDWLWNFVEVAGVEPTNNASERALRHAVIWRKLSFGTQSAAGSRFVETLLTVVETCRQQGRKIFAHLVNALESRLTGQPPQSLLIGL